jgi:3-oxoacyl-[acyl-carrier protein] reductase
MDEDAPLRGRIALVTGGSGGIGAALVQRLGRAGVSVAVGYGSHGERARELAAEIVASGGRAIAVGADMSAPDAPIGIVDVVEQALGPIDLLVPNAGVGDRRATGDVTADDWDRAMAVNLRAPFLMAQRVLPGMRDRGFGRILFTSSVAALTGGIVGPHYAASKAGLHGLVHHLAAREAPHGITVNAVAPALIQATGMLPGDPGELAARIPVGRLGRPDEVAALMVAVLENAYVTNQVISADGGMHPR